jgi:indolepyruvate ferredoxin oxidoreductase beta subunit
MTGDVLICGIGGQGVLLASDVLAHAALAAGLDVKKSEVHGMAQRGGSVESHVRFAEKVASPLVEVGRASLLLGCEAMETLRSLHFLRPGGTVVFSTQRVVPPSIPEASYPGDIEVQLRKVAARVVAVPALEMALELGNARVANVILLGAVSRWVELPPEAWQAALVARAPAKALEINLRGFAKGRELVAPRS